MAKVILCCSRRIRERTEAIKSVLEGAGHRVEMVHAPYAKGGDITLCSPEEFSPVSDHFLAFEALCLSGLQCINSPQSSRLCGNKALSQLLMERRGLPVPPAIFSGDKKYVTKQGIVRKPIYGSRSEGIQSFAPGQTVPGAREQAIDQQLIDACKYLRVYATTDRVVGGFEREIEDPLVPVSLDDASGLPFLEVSGEAAQIALQAVECHQADFLGVDLLLDGSGKYWIIEVNVGFGWPAKAQDVTYEWLRLVDELDY